MHAAAAVVPVCLYIATASNHAYWLDSSEFVGAGVELGIAHPPGHPLSALLIHLSSLLPLGSLALRAALAMAVCGGLAGMFVMRAVRRALSPLELTAEITGGLALAASFGTTASYGFWFQCVRPEVYAPQVLLAAIALEALFSLLSPSRHGQTAQTANSVAVAALSSGLALANHHFLAILLLPALAFAVATHLRESGAAASSILGKVVLFGAMGLGTYVYLPLRASQTPLLDLGHPVNLANFFWVVSAKAFQGTHGVASASAEIRSFDVLLVIGENVPIVVGLAAIVGLYALLRQRKTRAQGIVWTLILLAFTGARAWLGFSHNNPDAHGYILLAIASFYALAVSAVAVVLSALSSRHETLSRVAAILAVGLSLLMFHSHAGSASLATFADTDAFDNLRSDALPTGSVVLLHAPQSVLRALGTRIESETRPDLIIVPVPLLAYPAMAERLIGEHRELGPVLTSYLDKGEFPLRELQSLGALRPVFVEMDVRVPPSLYPTLAPHGGLYEVLADGATRTDVRLGASHQLALYDLASRVSDNTDRETRNQWLWMHYMDALFYAGVGATEEALRAASSALELDQVAPELVRLKDRLEHAKPREKLDPRLFFPGTQ